VREKNDGVGRDEKGCEFESCTRMRNQSSTYTTNAERESIRNDISKAYKRDAVLAKKNPVSVMRARPLEPRPDWEARRPNANIRNQSDYGRHRSHTKMRALHRHILLTEVRGGQ